MNDKTKLLELINDLEILLKQDERFYLSDDHKYKGKIIKLAKSNNFSSKSIDITPLVNLAKLHTKPADTVIINQTVETSNTANTANTDSLRNIIARLSELNKKMDNIVD